MTEPPASPRVPDGSPGPLTRLDAFLAVAGRPSATLEALVRSLWLPDGTELADHLEGLVAEGLLARHGEEFQRASCPRADLLFRALSFALAYGYDYNAYMERDLVEFLRRAYELDSFTAGDLPAGFLGPELLGRLMEDGLVLAFRYEPFVGRMVKNPFLDLVCEFLGVQPVRPSFFSRKIRLDTVIVEKLLAQHHKDMEQVARASRLLFPPGRPQPSYRPSKIQRILQYDLVPENQQLFDPQVRQNFEEALERMRQHVRDRRPLDVERIREYHGLLMRGTDFAGVLRTVAVQVRNNPHFRTAAPRTIPRLLGDLEAEYARRGKRVSGLPEVLALAAFVYNEFLYIHPFEDGNSRTARVVLAHVLREHRARFEEVPRSFDVRFLQVTKGAPKRDDRELLELLKEILVCVLNREELQKARELA